MKFRSKLTCHIILMILLICCSLFAKSQSCTSGTGSAGWTIVGTAVNTGTISFDWQNTTSPGQFQAGSSQAPNITSVTTPILQYHDIAPHSTVNIAFDLVAANSTSGTINGYEMTVTWGSGGTSQVTCGGGAFTISNTPARYNFQISGINLPGNHIPFRVKLKFFIWDSRNVNATNFKTDAALANSGVTLSVQLSSFTATRTNNTVNINWNTNYEINNNGYEVQRRYSTQNSFETIAFVNSKALNGTSTGPNSYSYTDINTSAAVSYYRIKQVNLDGTSKYTEIRPVDGSRTKAKTLVYPNPAVNGVANLIFATAHEKNIQVVDMTGRVVKSWNDYLGQELKVEGLTPGIYSIAIINMMTNDKETVRLVVTR